MDFELQLITAPTTSFELVPLDGGSQPVLDPPAAITNLSTEIVTGPAVALSWTLPATADGVYLYREEVVEVVPTAPLGLVLTLL
jgi:hypothetical protein